jgi:hypothetical protein
MATTALRRRKAQAAARATRARREKTLLVGGVVILAALLAFEGPKTLRSLRGTSSPPAATPAPASTTPASTATVPGSQSTGQSMVSRFSAKDPFVAQLGVNGTPPPAPTRAAPPRVRDSHFVAKDPFKQQLAVRVPTVPGPTPAVPPKVLPPRPVTKNKAADTSKKAASAPAAKAKPASKPQTPGQSAPRLTASVSGIVVIIQSVPVSQGIVAAKRAAVAARTQGVPKTNLLFSSRYRALRSGFYAVYSGPYSTSAKALNALKLARASGYASAYVRRIGR